MSSLIANKVKTNICLVSLSRYCTLFMCPTVSNLYNNNYNNNCLFDIFLRQLFAILLKTEIFKHNYLVSHNFTKD